MHDCRLFCFAVSVNLNFTDLPQIFENKCSYAARFTFFTLLLFKHDLQHDLHCVTYYLVYDHDIRTACFSGFRRSLKAALFDYLIAFRANVNSLPNLGQHLSLFRLRHCTV